MRRKRYTREFKVEAVRLSEESELPLNALADELGVHVNTLCAWRRQFSEAGEEAFPGHGKLAPADEEVRRLRRELAQVQQERDILKKAISFFAKESK